MQKKKILLFFFSLVVMAKLQAAPSLGTKKTALILQVANHLMTEHRYQEAADILEKVLMINSETEGAIEAYQKALRGIERKLLKITELKIEKPSFQAQAAKDWAISGKLELNTGWGSNLNRAPSDKNINITSEGKVGSLELSEQYQAQSGFGLEASASIFGVKKLSSVDSMNVSLQIENRTTGQEKFTDYTRINTGLSTQHKFQGGTELGVAFFTDILVYDNKTKFYALDLISRYAWKNSSNCHSQVGVDIQWQHQQDNPVFDSIYSGMMAGTNCYWWGGAYHLGFSLGNKWALDKQRVGGGQHRLLLQLSHDREFNWLRAKDRLNTYIHLEHRRDQKGYSILLANGVNRELNRIAIGGQYRFPMSYNEKLWWLKADIEWQKQYSNIQLFEYNALEVWLGVEVVW